jgi:hypothetical protein
LGGIKREIKINPMQLSGLKKILVCSVLLFCFLCGTAQPEYGKEIKYYADSLYQSFSKMQKISGLLSFGDTSKAQME